MSNKRRNRNTAKGLRQGAMGRARAQMKLAANLTEEQDWYLDTPDVRLTKIFTVVIALHLLAGGGILAFKMVDKASDTSATTITTARQDLNSAVKEPRETAAKVPTAVPLDAPARQAPPAPLRRDSAKGEQYKVLAGESLTEIATHLGVAPEALRAKNAIVSDNELYPGRWLTIPGTDEIRATPVSEAPKAAPTEKTEPRPSEYVVKAGDTPWAISRKFSVPFNQLMKENGIDNATTLQIGQKLRIPAAN